MAERKFLIVVVCFFLFNRVCDAQQQSGEFFPSFVYKLISYQYNTHQQKKNKLIEYLKMNEHSVPYFSLSEKNPDFFSLAPNFYSQHMGFFCRQELKLEKITTIPLRFRLGSVAYTDYLEQKPNAKKQ